MTKKKTIENECELKSQSASVDISNLIFFGFVAKAKEQHCQQLASNCILKMHVPTNISLQRQHFSQTNNNFQSIYKPKSITSEKKYIIERERQTQKKYCFSIVIVYKRTYETATDANIKIEDVEMFY